MTSPGPALPDVPELARPAAEILAATAAATGLPRAVVLDRAIRAWGALVAVAEAGELLWVGRPDADHLDRLTFNTHLGGGVPTTDTPTAGPRSTDLGTAGIDTDQKEAETPT